MTDDFSAYKPALRGLFPKRHYTVCHSKGEYVRGIASTNTVEGFNTETKAVKPGRRKGRRTKSRT